MLYSGSPALIYIVCACMLAGTIVIVLLARAVGRSHDTPAAPPPTPDAPEDEPPSAPDLWWR